MAVFSKPLREDVAGPSVDECVIEAEIGAVSQPSRDDNEIVGSERGVCTGQLFL
jgi:hypothetical protein